MKKENKSLLPISLKSIMIENFAGIKHTELEDLPGDAQWIFLTGENGFGKTSVLRGIAVGLLKTETSVKALIERNFDNPFLNLDLTGFKVISSRKTKTQKPIEFPEFAAYGASRLEIAHDASSNEASDKSGRLYSLFRSDGVLLSIEAEMRVWEKRDPTYFNNLRSTLLKVLDKSLGDIYVEAENAKVMYVELDHEGNKLPPVNFNQLASGYRSIVAMVGDLLIRFYRIYPKDTPPEEFAGIVLIDELDVHLHPKMQRHIPGILSKVFPKMQFIASIHSPIPILGAPENAVFLKVLRTKEEGITVHHLDNIEVRSLTPNTLLSSPIFDFDEIIGDHHKKDTQRLVTESSYDEAMFVKILEKKLKEKAIAANIDPNIIGTNSR